MNGLEWTACLISVCWGTRVLRVRAMSGGTGPNRPTGSFSHRAARIPGLVTMILPDL
jgi:hypothetical protein